MTFQRKLLTAAVAAIVTSPVVANDMFDIGRGGEYRSGDFHNHTTCSDGSTSIATLTRNAIDTYGHDWFIHVGHSGRGPRDCNVDDWGYQAYGGGARTSLWANTVGNDAVKGDVRTRTFTIKTLEEDDVTESTVVQRVRDMWRWQSLQEFGMEGIVEEREYPGREDKIAFSGLEWTVPGHEHSSNSIADGQYDEVPDNTGNAKFEYCFGRPSDDTSQGGGQGWTCELSEEANARLKAHFETRPAGWQSEGDLDYNASLLPEGVKIDDSGDHIKAVAGVMWVEENYPGAGMSAQAHVERQGGFVAGKDRGWNVEQMRDMNDLAPEVAFGFESQPGHQAQRGRGGYSAGRPTAGLQTYGGTGAYSAAEISRPGMDFDGNPLTAESWDACVSAAGHVGDYGFSDDLTRNVCSRPGVRTMWDAMLSEGRHFWFFGSSDWHNRGSFGPTHFAATNDFWPGEYQDNFTYVVEDDAEGNRAQDVIDALRSGNTYVVQGQLVDQLKFEACSGTTCATMGETLEVRPNALVRVTLTVNDPKGSNNSPYTFANPIHKQLGVEVPVDQPELAHVNFIRGTVHGKIAPADFEEYSNPLAPETTFLAQSFTAADWGFSSVKRMTYVFRATEDGYIRAVGSNIPAGTPNASTLEGLPTISSQRDNIPCDDALCPPHVNGILDYDLEAWAEVFVYTNPIFWEVKEDVVASN